MAQLQTVVLIDDLDGTPAEQTVTFSVDGQQYEIDLSQQNIQRLQNVLAPFITNARRTRPEPGTRRRTRRPHTPAQTTPPAATGTPPAKATTSEGNGTSPAHRPPVPAALFSNPHDTTPSRTETPPKPHTAGLFSSTG